MPTKRATPRNNTIDDARGQQKDRTKCNPTPTQTSDTAAHLAVVVALPAKPHTTDVSRFVVHAALVILVDKTEAPALAYRIGGRSCVVLVAYYWPPGSGRLLVAVYSRPHAAGNGRLLLVA